MGDLDSIYLRSMARVFVCCIELSGHFSSQGRAVSIRSPCLRRLKHVELLGKALTSFLTSASPLPSSAASCLAAPLSKHARPRHLSGPTGPASGPFPPALPPR